MNLLGILLKLMTSNSSVDSISAKTGLSSKQLKKLLPLMIPILIKYMTSNASSGNGATSLLGALAQHTNKKSMDQQLREADEEDGQKIIGHILGSKKGKVTQELSAETGIEPAAINSVLSIIAPALMSGVSGAASGASVAEPAAAPSITLPGSDLFSAFLGLSMNDANAAEVQAASAPKADNNSLNGTALLQMLLNARK